MPVTASRRRWQIYGTLNPDFATVEADVEQVNLTRFEVSLPEKRQFFLEGNELFAQRIRTFYSRRIADIVGAAASCWAGRVRGRPAFITAQTEPDDTQGERQLHRGPAAARRVRAFVDRGQPGQPSLRRPGPGIRERRHQSLLQQVHGHDRPDRAELGPVRRAGPERSTSARPTTRPRATFHVRYTHLGEPAARQSERHRPHPGR